MSVVSCLEIRDGVATDKTKTWEDIISPNTALHGQFIFTSWEEINSTSNDLRDHIKTHFNFPQILGSRLCLESNGFSGCDPTADSTLTSYNHWSRFMVKQIYKTLMPKRTYIPHHSSGERIHDSSSVQHGWEWYEMTFFVHWKLCENTTIICFNAPEKIRTSLQVTLTSRENDLDCTDPYSIFSFLTWELLTLYDTSVWTLRNHICDWEAHRKLEADYLLLHEIARHIIHVSETLKVALDSLRTIQKQQEDFMTKQSPNTKPWNKTQCRLQFQVQILQGLLARSESNKARLQNEITLAFNSATQRDSKIQVDIGKEAKKETSAMKAIAIVTMTFLPATFLSALFSMSFFHFEPPNIDPGFSVSNRFWIYWVLAAPLSLATIGTWIYWERSFSRRGID